MRDEDVYVLEYGVESVDMVRDGTPVYDEALQGPWSW